jgi:ribonuclease BN (tRNA processing enzyme)
MPDRGRSVRVSLSVEERPMKITLLPSAVSPGHGGRGSFLTSYVIDGVVAIDAGGLGLLGDLTEQFRIQDVFLTHSHLDHVTSLPIFLETVFQSSERCVTLHAGTATLESLRRDVFNDRVWPDFIGMSLRGQPFVKLDVLEPGRVVEVAGLRLTPIPVDHVVPTFGFLVEAPGVTVAIPSDTAPTSEFWRAAGAAADLKAVFLEASFPNAMSQLAVLSKHLTPAMFAGEIRKLPHPVPFIAVHIKPRFYDEVVAELGALGLPEIQVGRPGNTYEFDGSSPVTSPAKNS